MMRLVLLGAPGVGKGTQAQLLTTRHGVPQVSTGDILRGAIRQATPSGLVAKKFMDAGRLVPDDIVIEIVKERLAANDCERGFILDGFPRTLPQATALEGNGVDIERVVHISLPEEEIVKRLSGRRSCVECGAMYHIQFNPPTEEGNCDKCGAQSLVQRADDNPDTVRERLQVYRRKTQPLVSFYRDRGLLSEVRMFICSKKTSIKPFRRTKF